MKGAVVAFVLVGFLALSFVCRESKSLHVFLSEVQQHTTVASSATNNASVMKQQTDDAMKQEVKTSARVDNQSRNGRFTAESRAENGTDAGDAGNTVGDITVPTNATSDAIMSKIEDNHVHNTSSASQWLKNLPLLPFVSKSCSVNFLAEQMCLCYYGENVFDQIALQVVLRLLEHKFECSVEGGSSRLRIIDLSTDNDAPTSCFFVRPQSAETNVTKSTVWSHEDSIFLLPFLVPDFYAMPTMFLNSRPRFCRLGRVRVRKKEKKATTHISFAMHWRDLYQETKFCDYIGTSTREGLLIADSLSIPAVAVNANFSTAHTTVSNTDIRKTNYSPRAHPFGTSLQNRLHYTRAEPMAQSFPFDLFTTQQIKQNSSVIAGNRTLVVIIGSLRGGEKTWHSLYEKMLDVNSADLALMIGETNKSKTQSMYQRAKYVWEFPEYSDWADAVDTINGPEWRTKLRFNKNIGVLGGVFDTRGSGAIIFMARYWLIQRIEQLKLQEKYDRFVVTRSDFFYKCEQDLSQFDERYVWVPSGQDWGGITDRQVIAPSGLIIKVLNILPPLVKNPWRYYPRILQTTPEGQIWLQWLAEGIYPHHVRRFSMMMYTSFVPGDRSRWGDQSFGRKLGETEDGVFSKYTEEYKYAKCLCAGGTVIDPTTYLSNWTYADAKQHFLCTSQITNVTVSSIGRH